MSGKICIVTGANSGIGKETALGLAQMGARVAMVCRNAEKGKAALEEIRRESGSSQADLLIADMSSQARWLFPTAREAGFRNFVGPTSAVNRKRTARRRL